jgi:hypothetical protein
MQSASFIPNTTLSHVLGFSSQLNQRYVYVVSCHRSRTVRMILMECNKMDNFAGPPFCFTLFKLSESIQVQHSRTSSTDLSNDALEMLGYTYI